MSGHDKREILDMLERLISQSTCGGLQADNWITGIDAEKLLKSIKDERISLHKEPLATEIIKKNATK